MNTITKISLLVILPIFGITALYAQIPNKQTNRTKHKSIEYKTLQNSAFIEEQPLRPFNHKTTFSQNEIIKPVKAVEYNPLTGYPVENPFAVDSYFYDTTGMLVKEISDYLIAKEIEITTYSNKKFPDDGFLHFDTLTVYNSTNMEPILRYYNEHEIEQAEPYIARVRQTWNKSQSRWDDQQKTAYTYLDTISWYFIVRELYDPELLQREKRSLIYDENNNVSQMILQITHFYFGTTNKTLFEYYYPEGAHDDMTGYDSLYYYWEGSDDEPWIVKGKQTGITWNRWDGFDYESNQMASFYGWYVSKEEEGAFDLWGLQKYWYDIDGIAGSRTDTIYFYSDMYERWYVKATESEIYNEQGDFCEDRYISWENIELTEGILELRDYEIDSYINEYNDDGLLWRTSNYYTSLTLGYEDYLCCIWEVTEFADVTIVDIAELPPSENQLIIAPNPASGAITISAASEIEQLQIFDIVGRLIHNQTPTSKEVVFDTGILAKGVYLVRALLRDGAVQTGKIVKN